MIVTTAGRTNKQMIEQANYVAKELKSLFISRRKQSVEKIQQLYQCDCMIVGKERLELYPYKSIEPFFFHPNSASFRIKRLIKGGIDPLIEASKLEYGMTFLDCTMGLASDSIVASFIVGKEGEVIALEGNHYLQFIVNEGLQTWKSDIEEMNEAMKRIIVKHANYSEFLRNLPSKMVDVVYFDPMFEESILESDGIQALKQFAIYGGLTNSIISDARRVARKRIVLKDHFRSKQFEQLGFQVIKRKSAKFHFGVMEI